MLLSQCDLSHEHICLMLCYYKNINNSCFNLSVQSEVADFCYFNTLSTFWVVLEALLISVNSVGMMVLDELQAGEKTI